MSHTQKVERETKRLKDNRDTARLSKYKIQEEKDNVKKKWWSNEKYSKGGVAKKQERKSQK